ncbi:DUF1868 domain-containing protein [Tsukamurella strandjordii]|uniref:DUF1868 domain-containing protein n=1 Tax=Tsukamurella TaxID=2060 RepID=UPI001C7DDB0C|nr:DUF1868 domain-containing protein [Tsukamurella sp. TY48]
MRTHTPGIDRRTALAGLLVAGAGATLAGCGGGKESTPSAASEAPYPVDGRTPLAAGPGKKWDIEGNAQRFTGNTFVSPIPQNSAFFRAENQAQRLVRESRFRDHFALLPHNSMHMTVFEGVNQSQLGTPDWPAWLAGKDMQAAHLAVLDAVSRANITAPRPITMRVDGLVQPLSKGFGLKLASVDAATETALRDFRRRMQDLLQMSTKGFDTYTFHSTLGYRLVEQAADENAESQALEKKVLELFTGDAATVTVDPVAMNIFDDMLAFPQLRVL